MEIRFITPEFAVAPQPAPGDMAALKAAGVAALICNRPDGETPGQPSFGEIEAQARAHGIEARHLPVVPNQITAGDGAEFARLLDELPKPVLAYCRSGKRAESLWELARNAKGAAPGSV